MANPNGNPSNLTPFRPGQSGNPGGKPRGARNRLEADFVSALADDFREHGREAIEQVRTRRPSDYIRAIVALMPKAVEQQVDPLSEVDDDSLKIVVALGRLLRERREACATEAAESSKPL